MEMRTILLLAFLVVLVNCMDVYQSALKDPRLLLLLYKEHLPDTDGLQTSPGRFKIFRRNVERVVRINSEQAGYRAGASQMLYLSETERAQYAGLNVSRLDPGLPAPRDVITADRVDWVGSGHVTYVQNQGMCGSCWSFAGIGPLETRYSLATGTLKKLSEQESLDCVYDRNEKNGCRGGEYFQQWDWMKGSGRVSSAGDYPYKGAIYGCRSRWFKNQLSGHTVTGYVRTPASYKGIEQGLQSGPLAVGFRVPSELYLYKSGVFSKEDCGAASTGNHAVVAVGYTPDYLSLKNSWGVKWGESGFFRFSRGIENMCDVTLWAAYPVLAASGEEEEEEEECEDKRGDCEELREHCGNGENWKLMATGCARTCGICGCRNAMSDCAVWALNDHCNKPNYKEYMKYYCPLSCRKCPEHPRYEKVDCKDSNSNCRSYKSQGYCERYPEFVKTRCRKTCELCGGCEEMGLVECHGECRHPHMC